ncbi:hypothetical protein FRC05_000034 [Tulasnella sp. 425]|nr:hypothetical protein FRC05_000034 [Tulasnella sp. 425]
MVPIPRARKEAVITNKTRWYPAEDKPEPRPKATRQTAKPTRKSITPGTVLILLAGRFRGKRVIFLKQLESGLLLVTGPYRINGVPLRRVNQSYVIATSTKLDVSGVQIPDAVSDSYFSKEKSKKRGSAETEFFEEGKPKTKEAHPEQKASTQKSLDEAVIAEVKKVEHLASYLKASWGLSKVGTLVSWKPLNALNSNAGLNL